MSGSWQSDPTGRHLYRYHDGRQWTDQVADGGAATTDPYDGPPPPTTSGLPAPAGPPTSSGPGAVTGWPTQEADSPEPLSVTWSSDGSAWSSSGQQWSGAGGWSPGGGAGGGWSTGAKVGAGVGVLVLMALSGGIGFVIGAASDVIGDLDGVVEPMDAGLDEALDSGVVLSSDVPTWRGTLDGTTSFELRVVRPGTVTVEIVEGDFDTVLRLYDEAGALLADDDDSGEWLLSRVRETLEPGVYTVVVSSFSGGVDRGEPLALEVRFGG